MVHKNTKLIGFIPFSQLRTAGKLGWFKSEDFGWITIVVYILTTCEM